MNGRTGKGASSGRGKLCMEGLGIGDSGRNVLSLDLKKEAKSLNGRRMNTLLPRLKWFPATFHISPLLGAFSTQSRRGGSGVPRPPAVTSRAAIQYCSSSKCTARVPRTPSDLFRFFSPRRRIALLASAAFVERIILQPRRQAQQEGSFQI